MNAEPSIYSRWTDLYDGEGATIYGVRVLVRYDSGALAEVDLDDFYAYHEPRAGRE